MEKEFVPYDLALELKELGYNERNIYHYANGVLQEGITYNSDHRDYESISAPLYQQAFRWFREKYNLHSSITLGVSDEQDRSEFEYDEYIFSIEGVKGLDYDNYGESLFYKTYEEAELECLKKLIEIVEQIKTQ